MLPLLLFYVCVSIALAMIDIDTMRLPDVIVVPTTAVLTVWLAAIAAFTDSWESFLRGMIAGAGMLVFYGLIWWLSGGRGLGFGDVKMAFMLGAITGFFSWEAAIVAVISAWMLGGIFAMIGLITRKMKRGAHVPFGPFLIIGSWIGIVWGEAFVNWYLTTTGIIN